MAIKIAKGNIDDQTPVVELIKKLKGSIYADLFKALYKKCLKLITSMRKIMKNYLFPHFLSIVKVISISLKTDLQYL